jgi:opacity protein-like surface antigen
VNLADTQVGDRLVPGAEIKEERETMGNKRCAKQSRPHAAENGTGGSRFGGKAIARACLAILVVAFLPLLGRAQGAFSLTHGEWEASFFGGGSFLGSHVYATPSTGPGQPPSRAVGLRYGTGYQMGARLSDNFLQHWGATLEYSFSNQPITFTNLSDSVPSLGLGHSIHRFAYDINYYLRDRDSRWRPYVFAGPGVSLFYVKGPAKASAAAQGIKLSDPWKFTMNWGGGVKYLLRRQVAGSFQFSDSISGVPGYGLPKSGGVVSGTYVPGFRPDGYLNNWLISLGFIFQWEGW